MIWIIRIAVALGAILGLIALVGWMLPAKHQASRSADFTQSVEEIYDLVSNVRDYPTWWPDVSRVEMIADEPGRTTFREYMSDGPIVMTVVSRSPPTGFVTMIDDPDQPFGGTWTFEISPTSTGSRLSITERGEIYNVIFRVMAKLVFGYTCTMDSFLAAAARRLES